MADGGKVVSQNGKIVDKAFESTADAEDWAIDNGYSLYSKDNSTYADGGGVKNFDYNKLFESLSKEKQEILNLSAKNEEKKSKTDVKNAYAYEIKATGVDWNDAFINRVKSAKNDIEKFVEKSNLKDYKNAQDYWESALDNIESIRELGFEARTYANNLENKLRSLYNQSFIKGTKILKYEGGGISGTLHSTHTNSLEYLKAMGATQNTDLNYSTEENGINYYIGRKGNKAIVVAFIEDEDVYMIDKEDAMEMSETAREEGVEVVELYTNYGVELHSRLENPQDIGFDKIYKVSGSFCKGGSAYAVGGKIGDKVGFGQEQINFKDMNQGDLFNEGGNISEANESSEDDSLDLSGFTGTDHYYRYNLFGKNVMLTDGVKYLAEKAGAYWFINAILSWQIYKNVAGEEFQTWTLTKNESDDSATLVADDGNGNVIAKQEIEFTDFPMQKVSIWLVDGVLLLPSEY